jgi:hypothetical protein
MLSALIVLIILGLTLRLAFFIVKLCGKVIGAVFSLIGYILAGVVAIMFLGLVMTLFRIILIMMSRLFLRFWMIRSLLPVRQRLRILQEIKTTAR